MARLTLTLIGPFDATFDGEPITGFQSNKVRALLAFLAVEMARPHPRETLCGLLWPDIPDARAHHSLNQALCNLRHVVGDCRSPPPPSPFLHITAHTIRFNPHTDHWLDVAEFDRLVGWDAAPLHDTSDLTALRQAIRLYHGSFLEGFAVDDSPLFEAWVVLHRERLHILALDALRHLANTHAAAGELAAALFYARRQLQLDPWLEETHLQVMQWLAQSGRRSEALVQYGICRRVLAQELGVEPAVETTRAYERIRDGNLRG
jgi:DNA-binding SARP family transcriptional activator